MSNIQDPDFNKNVSMVYTEEPGFTGYKGLDFTKIDEWFTSKPRLNTKDIEETEIENLIKQRQVAKENKDYKLADDIRAKLNAMGITIEDSIEGTKWHKK